MASVCSWIKCYWRRFSLCVLSRVAESVPDHSGFGRICSCFWLGYGIAVSVTGFKPVIVILVPHSMGLKSRSRVWTTVTGPSVRLCYSSAVLGSQQGTGIPTFSLGAATCSLAKLRKPCCHHSYIVRALAILRVKKVLMLCKFRAMTVTDDRFFFVRWNEIFNGVLENLLPIKAALITIVFFSSTIFTLFSTPPQP